MKRVIGIVSGKGGTGKTVVATNLALALHNMGKKVILLDADATASNLGLRLGLYDFSFKLQDVIERKAKLEEAVFTHESGLKILPSSISFDDVKVNTRGIKKIVKRLRDIIIVDSPPGLCPDALDILDMCDEIVVVTNPELPTLANALKLIKIAKEKRKEILGLVVNRISGGEEVTIPEIEIMCETPVIAKIPEDNAVKKSLSNGEPLLTYDPLSSASIEMKKLAARVVGVPYEPPKYLLFKRFLNKLPFDLGVKNES